MVISVLIVLLAIFAGGAYFYQVQKAKKMQFLANKNFSLFVRSHSPRMGDSDAKVFMVEFLDPECEACRMIYPYVKELMKIYKGKVQLVVRYAPFHGNSEFAVRILEAARKQGKYWETMEIMFKHQPEWGNHHHPNPELIWDLLPQVGVDAEQVKKDMNDPAIDNILKQDVEDLQALEVRRTPSFFVNGKPLEKFGPEYLRALIDSAIEEVE